MNETYRIGNFSFRLSSDSDMVIPKMFQKFQKTESEPQYHYEIELTDELPTMKDPLIKRTDIAIKTTSTGEDRLLGVKGSDLPYAYYSELDSKSAKIYLDEKELDNMQFDPMFMSLLAMERQQMKRNCFILHCAYIEYKKQAILFSAPSETGKTTQANLWEKYVNTRTINGDRALLSIEDGKLIANGWPVCGSSEICENERFPVKAIVMLSQGSENRIRKLSGREAFIQLYSQITTNTWNTDFVNCAVNFIEDILQTIPVYHLSCTISKEAVDVLQNELIKTNAE